MINAQAFVHYKTGIKHLDEQHWELFLNLDALAACDNKDAAIAVIDNVIHQWALHSQAEEEYMLKSITLFWLLMQNITSCFLRSFTI